MTYLKAIPEGHVKTHTIEELKCVILILQWGSIGKGVKPHTAGVFCFTTFTDINNIV